jgi:hypothetical protein
VSAPSWDARGQGSLGLDKGRIDATMRLALSRALTDDLLGDSGARRELADASGRLAIPLRVQGSVERPRLTPDPKFTVAVARAVLGAGAGDALGRFLGSRRRRER